MKMLTFATVFFHVIDVNVLCVECIRKWNMQTKTYPMCVRARFVKEEEEQAVDYTCSPTQI